MKKLLIGKTFSKFELNDIDMQPELRELLKKDDMPLINGA
jgi:hypothetical protein